jgi:hypothetical protein
MHALGIIILLVMSFRFTATKMLNEYGRGIMFRLGGEMKTKVELLYLSLLLSLVIVAPATVRAESAVPLYDKTQKLLEQIQDIELMRRNVEECYRAEKQTLIVECLPGQTLSEHAELDGKLLNRVFGHLSGAPEYERFVTAYRALIQRPDYRRLYADELFAEYMRLLESGRMRLLTQLMEWQKSLAEKSSAQAHAGLAPSIPVKTVTLGHTEVPRSTESGRIVLEICLQVPMPLSGSTPLAVGQKCVSRISVHGMDQSGSAGAAAPTIDMVELTILVAGERFMPREKVSMGYHQGLVKGVGSGTATNLTFSDAVK